MSNRVVGLEMIDVGTSSLSTNCAPWKLIDRGTGCRRSQGRHLALRLAMPVLVLVQCLPFWEGHLVSSGLLCTQTTLVPLETELVLVNPAHNVLRSTLSAPT